MTNTKKKPINSYDWWFEKGEEDAKKRWEPNNWEPKHSKVKPYMDGWMYEQESRNGVGNGLDYHDFH